MYLLKIAFLLNCRCDPALQRDLGMMSYFQLVVDPRGRDLAKRLVTNVVNQQISQDMSVSCDDSADDRFMAKTSIFLMIDRAYQR
jgi:hypothetical protein